MKRRVFRHRVSVDDEPQPFELTSDPLHVEAGQWGDGSDFVDFWVIHSTGAPTTTRTFQVFGTGHWLPDNAKYVGTAARTPEGLVWHLFEVGQQ